MKKIYKKVTEGEGYISGDYEHWCIHPVPFEHWKVADEVVMHDGEFITVIPYYIENSIYTGYFVPEEIQEWENSHGFREPRVRYKVTFEVEILEDD